MSKIKLSNILGLILLTITVIIGINKYERYKIYLNNSVLEVVVYEVPRDCNTGATKLSPYFRFYLDDKLFTKKITREYCGIKKMMSLG
jgi:hypothetical protein